jgi:WhiB family redox-sensing transcriptional regulator
MTPRPFELIVTGSLDWMDQAACRGMDNEPFFQQGGHADEAKKVCATCPVRTDCLDYAIGCRIRHGIWGGYGREDRIRIAAARRRGVA